MLLVEKLANASSKDGCMAPSTSSKNGLGVITPLVTAERERTPFFCREGPLFVRASPLFLSGSSESFCIFFIFVFNLILIFFFCPLHHITKPIKTRPGATLKDQVYYYIQEIAWRFMITILRFYYFVLSIPRDVKLILECFWFKLCYFTFEF